MDIFWDKKNWEQEDLHLSRLKSLPFQRTFPLDTLKQGLYIIRGPRQVGKTSLLKTLLSKQVLLHGHQHCAYLSCENIPDRQALAETLKSLRHYSVLLLDEITYIKDWPLPIKYELDAGHFATLVITGSNATDLRKGSELLPGRFGAGGEVYLLPMDFAEFSQMRKMAQVTSEPLVELELYFKIGGFPSALAETITSGNTPVRAKDTYLKWLIGDVLKAGKREIYLREIMGQLALSLGTPISLQKLAQKTQMGSHHTALEYVEILEDCFALKTLYAIDLDNSSFRFRKDKKFYFTDPLLYWLALDYSGYSPPIDALPLLAEQVVHEALSRRYSQQRFGYFSSNKGEIDFLCPHHWAIEVKWSFMAQNLSKAYLNYHASWKTVWTKTNFLKEWPPTS